MASINTLQSETALLLAARGGDGPSLEQFCRTRFPWMRRIALLELGQASLVDDAVQDAMMQLISNLQRWDPDRPFEPWLATIVRNSARQQRRRWRPWSPLVDRFRAPRMDTDLDLQRASAATLKAFALLSPGQRQAVYHVDVLGLPVAEVAVLLDANPSTLRVQVHKARKKLRHHLGEWRTVLEIS